MGILNKVRPASFFFFLAIPFLLLVFFHIPVSAESKSPEMTLEEAARFLGTSNRDMEYLLNMGQISAHKVRGQWRISRDSVERFLKKLKSKNRKLSNPNEPMSERQLKQTLGGELDRPLPDSELQGGESESTVSESKLKKEEEEEKLLIEYLSLRGQGVLLKQGQIIIENSFSFILNESNRRFIGDIGAGNELVDQTTEDRIFRYDFILRYGLLDELQFSADIPYLYREREIDFLGATSLLSTSQDLSNEGLGDIGLGLRYHALKESKHGFDLILLAEGFIPADSEPESIFISQDPLISLGQFGFSGGVTLIKPVDPAVLFLTVAGNHFFSKNVSNQGNLNAFTTLSYAGGFSIALNDDFAPFISVSGTHTLKDREIVPLASNPSVQEFNVINLRIGFDYRLSKAMYIEPSVIFGLSEDASDVFFNLSIPYQF